MFQIASDIHLELLGAYNQDKVIRFIEYRIKPAAPFLLLAGDIGQASRLNYNYLLEWASKHFVKVFVVTGNHEYYHSRLKSMDEVDNKHREVCKLFPNVYFLQKDRFDFSYQGREYTILGCTFWAVIPLAYRHYISSLMNDFNAIRRDEMRPFTPEESHRLHLDHSGWLFGELAKLKNAGRIVIVLTHHTASLRMDKGTLACGYSSNYEEKIPKEVYLWASGHTHENLHIQTKTGTWLISNCIGYLTQSTGYKTQCII
jgi:DNA repair exonuclease SbcCD nuclease subunit